MSRCDKVFEVLRFFLPPDLKMEKNEALDAILISDPEKNLGFAITAQGFADKYYLQRFQQGLKALRDAAPRHNKGS